MQISKFLVLVCLIFLKSPNVQADDVYDHVIESGKIRCGYFVEYPFIIKDPNTGNLSGIAYDLAEKMGAALGLEVEWVQEVSFPAIVSDLETRRYDALCSSLWNIAPRNKFIDYTNAFINVPISGFVSPSSSLNAQNYSKMIEKNAAKIALLDGEGAAAIALETFGSNINRYDMPQTASIAEVLEAVKTGKADIAFVILSVANNYLSKNPGNIRNVSPNQPFYKMPNAFGIKRGAFEFKAMLNNVMQRMIISGAYDRIIDKYDDGSGALIRVSSNN